MSPKNTNFFCLSLVAAFLLVACANPVTPAGGPKDVKKPSVTACEPPNHSVKFNTKNIRIEFDEFINLKNPLQEIFISPPLKQRLETKLRGKSLLVLLNDTLASNTTYSISFGNAISDLTENNILTGFTYVFSTGDFIDSLSLKGTLVNAFDLLPQKDVFIELYTNNNDSLPLDSLPLHVPPYYVTKSDENGNYLFNNLKNSDYLLFALSDQNGDLVFNQLSEKIAFSDTLVKPYHLPSSHIDTLKNDSLPDNPKTDLSNGNPDGIAVAGPLKKPDSLSGLSLLYPSYTLSLFEETDSVQRLINARFLKEGMATLSFRFPIHDFQIVPLNFDSLSAWAIYELSKKNDSLTLWITRPKTDTLIARLMVDNQLMDTLRLFLVKKESPKKNDKKNPGPQLTIQNPASTSGLNQFKNNLDLVTSYPLTRWDFSRVLLVSGKDTVPADLEFTDSLKRRIRVIHPWEEEKNYTLLIPDSVFFSINGLSHDSILLNFRTKAEKEFGNLTVTLDIGHRPGQYIVQLLNDKETSIIDEQIVDKSTVISMKFVNPGQFKLKAILDKNKNRKWDTGNYRSHIQPEEVFYLPKKIEIRSNWDVEENWAPE